MSTKNIKLMILSTIVKLREKSEANARVKGAYTHVTKTRLNRKESLKMIINAGYNNEARIVRRRKCNTYNVIRMFQMALN